MTAPGPTHSGSPFVGRTREIGILTHLLAEGLEGRHGLIRVAGSTGYGRRRLIAEALNRGPDAEWIHLAPGGVEPDLERWMRTELIDLLDTYPDAPFPSWAIHAIEPFAPAAGAKSAVPALSRERVSSRDAPLVLGRAIGAVLTALTGRTSVIVDAGLWPETGDLSLTLSALVASLQEPGTIMIAAAEARDLPLDPPEERTLLLEPLDADSVSELVERWESGKRSDTFAAWLQRVTNGHPFFIHETVRWLEELGHLHVHEEERRVELFSSVERWPIPLSLHAVMEMRHGRLPPAAARILSLIAREDGRVDLETLRLRWEDDDSFEEGMAWLRRRDFLRDRALRRPLALASPAWRSIARANVFRLPAPALKPPIAEAPLARMMARIEGLTPANGPEAARRGIADIARRLRGRRGPVWDGARGRLAVHAARLRISESRLDRALVWVRWGIAWTTPDIHPALRRSLRALLAEIHERAGRPVEASICRHDALEEALASGHLLAASRLRVLVDEASRRAGDPFEFELHPKISEKGLASQATLAAFTGIAAHIDRRELADARHLLEFAPSLRRLSPWIERLETGSPKRVPFRESIPPGWTWGLGNESTWMRILERVEAAFEGPAVAALADLQAEADRYGFRTLAADLAESRIWLELGVAVGRGGKTRSSEPRLDRLLVEAARAFERLGFDARTRDLALSLRDTEAGDHPLFPELFGSHLLKKLSTPLLSSPPTLALHFTGLPRVEHGGRTWAGALWPEWWAELWSSAVSAALLETPLHRNIIEPRLRALGHLPVDGLDQLVAAGNELFRGPERSSGGLVLRDDTMIVEWGGITCDVRSAWQAFQRARNEPDSSRARDLFGEGLDRIEGPYLSGFESPEVDRARSVLVGMVRRALEVCLTGDDLPAARWVRWLEGPVRMIGDREIAARFIEKRGLRQAALALRHG